MFEHKEADRIPIIDSPWGSTIERWRREGMPEGADFRDYFDLDRTTRILCDNSPRYERKVLEETDKYVIATTQWGVTTKNWKHSGGTPEFIDFTATTPEKWKEAKARMTPDRDRVPWDQLKKNYKRWRESGTWIEGILWFGFDITHSHMVGTERTLMALVTDPEWVVDMYNHELDVNIALLEMVLAQGYELDAAFWYDDMGYKLNQFFSLKMYRELLKPVHKRAIEWAHSKGLKTHLHSCGDIRPFIPELVGMGLDALNPLEVKAGMDPEAIKKEFGSDLVLHGGINAVLWDDYDAISEAMEKTVPALKQDGMRVQVVTDSQYVSRGMTEWLPGWLRNNWRRGRKANAPPVKNVDLWKTLVALCDRHRVDFVYVRGHAGHPENEECDRMAVEAVRQAAR